MNDAHAPSAGGELLYGVGAIATLFGITRRQAQHLVTEKRIPFWKEGRLVIAHRQSLLDWMDTNAAAAMAERQKS